MPAKTRFSSKHPVQEAPAQDNLNTVDIGSRHLGLGLNPLEQSSSQQRIISTGSSNDNVLRDQTFSGPVVNESANNKKKRVRGPTFMPTTWGIQPEARIPVSFNEIGQPNDLENTSTLASFLGVLARNPKYCPLNYDDWRHMPDEFKEDMKKAVKSRFGLTNEHDDFILTSINDKWRKWKSRVKKSNFKTNVPLEQQTLNWSDRVDEQQYMKIAKHWSSEKAQKVSDKNKDSRAQLIDVHHMGQCSFALNREIMKEELGRYPKRAEMYEKCFFKEDGSPASDVVRKDVEKMKELSTKDPQIEHNGILHNEDDEFAKVKGPDKDGQVRMYGLGVRANDVYGKRATRTSLLWENMKYKQALDKLAAEVDMLKARDQGNPRTIVEVDKERNPNSSPNMQSNPQSPLSRSQNNNESSPSISHPRRIKEGSHVLLKSLINIGEIVAAGFVREIGGVKVNNMTLGPAFYNIQIHSVYKKDEPLAFPYDHIQTMEDALGAPVAWPFTSIFLDEDD